MPQLESIIHKLRKSRVPSKLKERLRKNGKRVKILHRVHDKCVCGRVKEIKVEKGTDGAN